MDGDSSENPEEETPEQRETKLLQQVARLQRRIVQVEGDSLEEQQRLIQRLKEAEGAGLATAHSVVPPRVGSAVPYGGGNARGGQKGGGSSAGSGSLLVTCACLREFFNVLADA